METMITYLTTLQNQVFKLLPMREAFDCGENNHLYDYLDNLILNCSGALKCFPEIGSDNKLISVYNNLASLTDKTLPFGKWRSIVLRSTRLIGASITKYSKE